MQKGRPDVVKLNAEEAEALQKRIKNNSLTEDDLKIFSGLINFSIWLQAKLVDAKITIRKLYKVFNITSEKRKKDPNTVSTNTATNEVPPDDTNNTLSTIENHSKNNGKIPTSAYSGAEKITLQHNELTHGSNCPNHLCTGKLYNITPGNIIRITSGGLAVAKQYTIEKLRCYLCGATYSADLPSYINEHKYDEQFKATLVIHKYYMGTPFHRIEMLQALLGIPLPDSTQWQLVEEVADSIYPIFFYLEKMAAQGELFNIDDTKSKILSVIRGLKSDLTAKRRGTFTTAICSKINARNIYLIYTGCNHAGENAIELLKKRKNNLSTPLYMCDALASNMPDELAVIICNCLAHARRGFSQNEPFFPEECSYVLDALGKVYHNDSICKQLKLNNNERLAYHKAHSAPIMHELNLWLNKQFDDHLIEPNSNLGKAITYILKHWKKLTRFLYVAGAPLDNNLIERTLKIPIRIRKNAMFFATTHGAFVGSMLLSIIITCVEAGENPVKYLTYLQKNKTALFKEPHKFLPWNYKENILINHQGELQ